MLLAGCISKFMVMPIKGFMDLSALYVTVHTSFITYFKGNVRGGYALSAARAIDGSKRFERTCRQKLA